MEHYYRSANIFVADCSEGFHFYRIVRLSKDYDNYLDARYAAMAETTKYPTAIGFEITHGWRSDHSVGLFWNDPPSTD